MKKLNAMLIAGSLLVAGAVLTPALAYDSDCNDGRYNNGWSNWRNRSWNNNNNFNSNRSVNRYVRTNPYWNSYGNGMYNSYSNQYYNPNPGFFTRVINRIF